MGGFSDDQIKNFDPSAMGGLSDDQVKNFDPSAMASFNSEQFKNFDPSAMGGFSDDQIKNFDPSAMGGFSDDQVKNFDPSAMGGFNSDQIKNFDPSAMGGFIPAQVMGMDSKAAEGFEVEQVRNLLPESRAAVGDKIETFENVTLEVQLELVAQPQLRLGGVGSFLDLAKSLGATAGATDLDVDPTRETLSQAPAQGIASSGWAGSASTVEGTPEAPSFDHDPDGTLVETVETADRIGSFRMLVVFQGA